MEQTHGGHGYTQPYQPLYPKPEQQAGYAHTEPYAHAEQSQQKSRRLGTWAVAALASLVTAVVIGAALGGGLGSALSNCENEKRYGLNLNSRAGRREIKLANILCSALSANAGSSPSTTTITLSTTITQTSAGLTAVATTTTAFIPTSPTDIPLLSFTCSNNTVSESQLYSGSFKEHCGVDFGSNYTSSKTDSAGTNLRYFDIVGIIVYTLSDCYQACLNLNTRSDRVNLDSSGYCRGVTFNAELAAAVDNVGASCWLKNGTPADVSLYSVNLKNTFLSAELVGA